MNWTWWILHSWFTFTQNHSSSKAISGNATKNLVLSPWQEGGAAVWTSISRKYIEKHVLCFRSKATEFIHVEVWYLQTRHPETDSTRHLQLSTYRMTYMYTTIYDIILSAWISDNILWNHHGPVCVRLKHCFLIPCWLSITSNACNKMPEFEKVAFIKNNINQKLPQGEDCSIKRMLIKYHGESKMAKGFVWWEAAMERMFAWWINSSLHQLTN